MNPKKYPRLVLLLTAIVTVMCRCSLKTYTDITVKQTQGDPAKCFYEDYWWENGAMIGHETTCNINCPNGKIKQVTFPGPDIPDLIITEDYCTAPATAQPSPTATTTATATSTLIPTFAAPVLTGEVTTCNPKDGFINFKLVASAPELASGDVLLTINEVQVNCTVAGNNKDVLSCALPVGVAFPAQIHVEVADASTNDFVYDGSGCATDAPGGGGGGTAPTANPGGD